MTTRCFFTHLFTLMFNLSNLALYVDSPDEFLGHYNNSNQRLSSGTVAEKCVFAAILVCICMQAYCNQKTYSKTIDRVLPNHRTETGKQDKPQLKRTLALSLISAIFKASVASTSLAALLKNQWNVKAAWTLAVLCFPGNASSQFAIFATQSAKKHLWHLSYWPKCLLSHGFALTYNLPNVALYFNAANGFLKHIQVREQRLTNSDAPENYIALTILGIFSLSMLMSTQLTYSKKIADVFTDPKKLSQTEGNRTCCTSTPVCTKIVLFGSGITAFYKTLVTSLELITLTYTITNNLPAGIAVAATCFFGNTLAQFSIFKPEKAEKSPYVPIEAFESKAWCCGLFGETVLKETVGCSLQSSEKYNTTLRNV